MIRGTLALGLTCIVAAPVPAQETVTVGYRSDAPPFSAIPRNGDEYEGFLVYLCDGALASAGFDVTRVPVTATDRFAKLDKAPEDGGVDMLCDPMSITPGRASKYLLSPQVFATGVGFLRQEGPPPADDDGETTVRVGYLGGTTADRAVTIAEDRGVLTLIEDNVVVRQPEDLEIRSHYDGVTAVCSGALWFYFGDLDILKALQTRAEKDGTDCSQVRTSTEVFSYEAYALPVSTSEPELAVALQGGLYRMFSEQAIYDEYDRQFDGHPRSPILQAVFSLNGVYPPPGLGGAEPDG